jgi:hypothetical protein
VATFLTGVGTFVTPKIDDLSAPDDNTDLNASTTAHGLLKKLDNDDTHYMDGKGNWTAPAGGPGGGAPADAQYIVGTADGDLSAEKVKAQLYNNYNPDDTPASPNALDDEFDDSSLNVKWTLVNDPGISETTYPGFVYVSLTELGTDNYAALIQMGQTAPTGTAAMEFTAKVCVGETGESANVGEFAGAGIMFNNTTDSEMWGPTAQMNDVSGAAQAGYVSGMKSTAGTLALPTTSKPQVVIPSQWIYLKLAKTTTSAYTSANTYIAYYSCNGIIWQEIATESFTFTHVCDTVGIYFRRPKSQTGTPACYALVDFFRRTI